MRAATTALAGPLVRAARAVVADVEQVLKPEDLTFDQWLVLDALATDSGLAMAELAERTATPGPTLTRLVDRLVTNALLYREVDPADRRKVLVHLSRRGQHAHRRIAPRVAAVERELLTGLRSGAGLLDSLRDLAEGRP
ncbi:DNA-binding transcriptional regulator, MarR family [Saccharopolyspora kobensis]|uniref:DNA-binding transcriptional regulator, MarR family n=1 Tax=Saccharopolyspora kobensis TaxID=146035 RepID=A0A1H6DTL8_9PSEU|nr:MarR family transcriptional regulator [Saccharopolyspora kobensis]SEG87945.1 DNA-binding transcriptional regulator, MarR family [Saccharopolyspora kobensis]SFE04033.1 DNA-binding transcriptional regulator, MarR family [Saccharopolyspora kobensis]